jgi:hypothetical protein
MKLLITESQYNNLFEREDYNKMKEVYNIVNLISTKIYMCKGTKHCDIPHFKFGERDFASNFDLTNEYGVNIILLNIHSPKVNALFIEKEKRNILTDWMNKVVNGLNINDDSSLIFLFNSNFNEYNKTPSPLMDFNKKVLSHEIVHLLDYNRGNKMFLSDTSKETDYNNPTELNAYILELFMEFVKKEFWKIIKFNDFNKFRYYFFEYEKNHNSHMDVFSDTEVSEVYKNLNDENKRKFDKRLYNLWVKVREKKDVNPKTFDPHNVIIYH